MDGEQPVVQPALPKSFTFFGSYDHSLDTKGRIIVPTAYRKTLGETFTVAITRDDAGIALYPDDVYDQLLMELYALNRRKPVVNTYIDHLTSLSFRGMQADSQGRLLVPLKLRQYVLGEAKELVISGALDHVRIVSSKAAQEAEDYFKAHRAEILEEIGNE